MFDTRVRILALRLLMLSAVFLTPLLLFTPTHDQFELPKLIFLGLLVSGALALSLTLPPKTPTGPLTLSLLLLLAAQTISSLPSMSLSWQASLLGDYENFSGLATFFTYLSCFLAFQAAFNSHATDKPFFFFSLSAFLSSLYAVAQHFGLDFIQWNPTTIISTREFASLGNPNFLSAFLAMVLPLWLAWLKTRATKPSAFPSPLVGLGLFLGLCFLYWGTAQGHSFIHPDPPTWMIMVFRLVGIALFTPSLARLIFSMGSWFGIPALAILALGLVATGSRGGFFAAILGWGVYLACTFRKKYSPLPAPQTQANLLPKAIVLLVLLAPSLWVGRSFLVRFFHSLTHLGESLSVSRLEIWRPALKMVQTHPFFGVGLDTFKTAFPYYSGIGFNKIDGMFVSSRTAHNQLLQLASTTGLIGLGAYFWVWGTFFFLAFKLLKNVSPFQKTLTAGVIGCVVAYHAQNLFSFDVAILGLVSFWALSWIESLYASVFHKNDLSLASGRLGGGIFSFRFFVFGILILSGIFYPLTRLGADLSFGESESISEYLKKPDPDSQLQPLLEYSNLGIEECQRAAMLCPLDVKYRLYLGLAFEQRAQLDKQEPKKWLEAALQTYHQGLSMSPFNGYYYNDEGRVCENLAELDPTYRSQAVQAFQQAVHWSPASPFFWINLAQAQQENGNQGEAAQALKQAFELDSAFTAKCLAQSAVLDFQNGRNKDALEKLQTAMDGNTTTAEPYFYRGLMELDAHMRSDALKDFLEAKKRVDPANPGNMSNLDAFIQQASSLTKTSN